LVKYVFVNFKQCLNYNILLTVPSPETSGAPKLEDTLADYQPPKRQAKKEDKDGVVGPSVFITVSCEVLTIILIFGLKVLTGEEKLS
jgi:hypothetical protein